MTDKTVRGGTAWMPTFPVIMPASECALGSYVERAGGEATSGANPFAANEMIAFPFRLTAPVTPVNKGFWLNGSSAGSNYSMAIYNADYVRVVQSASTGGSGANVPQAVSLTAKLSPGLYYCALASDAATTNRLFRVASNAPTWKVLGCWKQASITVGSLPSTATPVAYTATTMPIYGLITRTVFDV